MSANPEERVGQVLAGRFRIVGLIGAGGMGAVYDVSHEYTKQRGALKLLHKQFAAVPEIVQRFINEASAAGQIDSPHIIKTYDAGRVPETDEPYIFMERLQGAPLSSLLGTRGQLRFDEAVELISQVALGLEAAHAAGIVHRDIKPDNLFLVRAERPFVKILDFGISKFTTRDAASANLTQEGTTLGTPSYMPPEQFMGQRGLDHRADVYSLGVVLYECVTGHVPYRADVYHELCRLICDGKYAPASEYRSDAPPLLDQVLARAMAADREQRYATMTEFRTALAELSGSGAVSFARTFAEIAPEAVAARSQAEEATDISARDVTSVSPLTATPQEQRPPNPAAARGVPAQRQTTTAPSSFPANRPEDLGHAKWSTAGWWLAGVAVAAALGAWLGLRDETPATVKPTDTVATSGALGTPKPEAPNAPSVVPVPGRVLPLEPAHQPGNSDAGPVRSNQERDMPTPKNTARRDPAAQAAPSGRRSVRDGLSDKNPFK